MGQSTSIKSMAESDEAFRNYIAKLRSDLQQQATDVGAQVQKKIDDHYASSKFTDQVSILNGQNFDFVHQKEFSLENLKGIVDAIANAVFAGGTEPPGVNVNGDGKSKADDTLGPAVGQLANLETYIASKVFRVLGNVILSFGTATEVTFTTDIRSEPLGYGLQLFSAVSSESYQSTDFFNKDYIYEYLYIYDVRFSAQQAKSEIVQKLIQDYQDEIAVYSSLHQDLNKQLLAKEITFQAWLDTGKQFDAAQQDLIKTKNDLINNAMHSGKPELLMAM
jgi:hypothetical protein